MNKKLLSLAVLSALASAIAAAGGDWVSCVGMTIVAVGNLLMALD